MQFCELLEKMQYSCMEGEADICRLLFSIEEQYKKQLFVQLL